MFYEHLNYQQECQQQMQLCKRKFIDEKLQLIVFNTLIVLNEEIKGIMQIIKSLEESGLLIKGISQTIKNETNKQKARGASDVIRNSSC